MDTSALFKLNYGLYLLTAHDGETGKDNGCIINTVMQVTSAEPFTGVIAVSKHNHTHDMVMRSKEFNISVLTRDAPFALFERFGLRSGRDTDKLAGMTGLKLSRNGVLYLTEHTNSCFSCEVSGTVDFGSHTLFVAKITDIQILSDDPSITYDYYRQFIKPVPPVAVKTGFRCKICSYIHEDSLLPADLICPLCKHGAADFEEITNEKENTDMTELKGTKTEQNLMEAFAGESQARNKYTYFAGQARKEGYEQIAALFEETALNEKEHAKIWFKLLSGGKVPSTVDNLKAAASGENGEWTDMYKRMAADARSEGFDNIAALFDEVGAIEKAHEERYLKLLGNINDGSVFRKTEKMVWICRNCGHLRDSTDAPVVCPVCVHPQAYFELRAVNY